MHSPSSPFTQILSRPVSFGIETLKRFNENQGLLLAAAIAYYALLSLIPLLTLVLIVLSHFIDPVEIFSTLRRYLEWFIPGQSKAIVSELSSFVENRNVISWLLLGTMLFFSSLAFSVLEKSLLVIFRHRMATCGRHFLASVILPYCYMLFLGFSLLLLTLASIALQMMSQESIIAFGHQWGLGRVSGVLFYLLGFASEVLLLTGIYVVMPIGRTPFRYAMMGGTAMAVLWEITRHVLAWYFATLSQASAVYGSLTTAIVVLLSFEIGAIIILFGAQVIAEYEKVVLSFSELSP